MAVLKRTGGETNGIMRHQKPRARIELVKECFQSTELLFPHAARGVPKPAVSGRGVHRHEPERADTAGEWVNGIIDPQSDLPRSKVPLERTGGGRSARVLIVISGHCDPGDPVLIGHTKNHRGLGYFFFKA